MPHPESSPFRIDIAERVAVTARVNSPARLEPHTPALMLAHGANNNLEHPLLAFLAARLAETADILVLRFNFPYIERGAVSPDPQGVLESTFKRVHDHLVDELIAPGAPVFVGGKSLGGRVAAELVSRSHEGEGLLATGLIVLGYPLHAPGRKDHLQLEPLRRIDIPSLFCIGSRDPLCDADLLRPILAKLFHPGDLHVVQGGDHSLRLAQASGGQPEDSYAETAEAVADFIKRCAESRRQD